MGRCDNVVIGMSITSFRDLWEREGELFNDEDSLLDNITEFIERKNEDIVFLFWKDIDWNSAAAQRINDFLRELDLEGIRSYSFVRLGEDIKDIEEYYIQGMLEPAIDGIKIERRIIVDSGIDDWYTFSPDFISLGKTN